MNYVSVLEEKIASVKEALEAKALEEALQSETIDVTMPGRPQWNVELRTY